MNKQAFLMGVIVLCLGALVYLAVSGNPEPPPPPLPDAGGDMYAPDGPAAGPGSKAPAPNFTLQTLDGGKISMSDLRGKAVVINFWSTSCFPCILEMPAFEELNRKMAGQPFQILAITPDPRDSVEKAAARHNINVDILLDPDGAAAMRFGVYATPTTFIIAPDGTVDNKIMGAADWGDQSVVDYLTNLIKAQPPEKEEDAPDDDQPTGVQAGDSASPPSSRAGLRERIE